MVVPQRVTVDRKDERVGRRGCRAIEFLRGVNLGIGARLEKGAVRDQSGTCAAEREKVPHQAARRCGVANPLAAESPAVSTKGGASSVVHKLAGFVSKEDRKFQHREGARLTSVREGHTLPHSELVRKGTVDTRQRQN